MIAGGVDASGRFLLTVSHTGRGVFQVGTWERVARDITPVYPKEGRVTGIGPLGGVSVSVHEIDYATEVLEFKSSDSRFSFRYSEGILTVFSVDDTESAKKRNHFPQPTPSAAD